MMDFMILSITMIGWIVAISLVVVAFVAVWNLVDSEDVPEENYKEHWGEALEELSLSQETMDDLIVELRGLANEEMLWDGDMNVEDLFQILDKYDHSHKDIREYETNE